MHRHVAVVLVMLCVVVLATTHYLICNYESWPAKTATAKELAWEMGILVREAERHLGAYLFLDEYLRWECGRPHCPYILQQMFAEAQTAGQKEFNCGIPWGHQQSMLKQDPSMEVPTIDLVGYKTTQEEIIA